MQELTQADFEEYGLEKSINLSWLNNKNVRLYYIDQDNTCTCVVKIDNEIRLQILTKNKEKTLKWATEDVKKYL
jgi:predicted RNA-binding protein (virulence factor B family)